jgi:AbiU2
VKNAVPIPRGLQEKLDAVDREVVLLHFKWTYFRQLFGTEKGVAIINATASSIFSVIEEAMFADILLTLMRLVDPPKSSNRPNLSLRSLALDIPDRPLKEQFDALEIQIRAKTQDIKIWRDKKLAHNDLLRLLKQTAPVPPIQIPELTEALSLIREAMNLIHSFFFDRAVLYDQTITEKDGKQLLFHLSYGLDCWTEDKEKGNFARARKLREQT